MRVVLLCGAIPFLHAFQPRLTIGERFIHAQMPWQLIEPLFHVLQNLTDSILKLQGDQEVVHIFGNVLAFFLHLRTRIA